MDARAALDRLRGLISDLERVLPGPDILNVTHAEESAAEVVDAFYDLDRSLAEEGPDVKARTVDHQTTAVTIAGVDVYVRNASNAVVVSVGSGELPEGKQAFVESFDGVSWEHELP
jgi:hypothetical protein